MNVDAKTLWVAVASDDERGLAADVSAHFGRCPAYTFARVEDGKIHSHRVVANPHYVQHLPGAVPQFLAGEGADVVLAGGMGPRAVAMFQSLGIQVTTGIAGTVADALAAWIGGARGIVPCHHDHPDSCGENHD